jgi:hypothetical protein
VIRAGRDRNDLMHGQVAALEAERGADVVQPPDALALLARLADRLLLVRDLVREPRAQGERIVLSE